MHSRNIIGLALLALSLAAPVAAAPRAALADAVEQRDKTSVRALLQTGADVNAAQVDGTTALHWAVYHDDAETVALLLRAGANVNAVNRYGVPPLAQACKNGNAATVQLLLDGGADANATMKGGETVLMLAARSGNAEAVQALLARGANPKTRERLGQTALMWAAAGGHTPVVRALIKAGADVDATLESGFTPFFFAVREGHLDTVRAFLTMGADVNKMLQPAERVPGSRAARRPRAPVATPLALAVQNAHFELAIALIEAGADPNDVRTGFTPLHMLAGVRKPDSSDISDPAVPTGAGRLSSLEFVREIVKRGANVNFRLPKDAPAKLPNTSSAIAPPGATPLLLAADRDDVPLMRLLVELGADPLIPNFKNTTPLMAAAGVGTEEPLEEGGEESEAVEAVKMLLDLGADINGVDDDGNTPMHGAAYNIAPLVVKLLAERGADPKIWNQPNKLGVTPLFSAEGYGHRLPRPDAPTIEAVTKVMLAAGLSTEGKRPKITDAYEKIPDPSKPAEPEK